MSRSIYERRQLRPYKQKWELREVIAVVIGCIVLLTPFVVTAWMIVTSNHPWIYGAFFALALAAIGVLLQSPPNKGGWKSAVLTWLFTNK